MEKPLFLDYAPLEPLEIRILVLHQGSTTDTVECTLRHVLRDQEQYHALSYEWGEEVRFEPGIIVDDLPVRIRKNLYEALKEVRKPSEDLQLWVDAICINQADLEEKNSQVAMMGETFEKAAGVIAWLGVARDNSDVAMDWMANTSTLSDKLNGVDADGLEKKAIAALCNRTYWRRVWIIQELYLSKSYDVRCGTKSIPADVFEESLATMNDRKYEWTDMDHNPADHLGRSRLFKQGAPQFNTLNRWLKMCILGKFQCTREQDTVFSLLGIAHDCRNGSISIEVDYRKSPRDIYLEVLREGRDDWCRGLGGMVTKLAGLMNLEMDESLKDSVFGILGKKIGPDGLFISYGAEI
ncbi:hypothetical protein NM208_g1304 [Fusarium decemcellulare]|uniref:Uncharacterized protein n=1 Tax=Fusarium decemcellulare TaxID=57161 RepID=A0ACC1SWK4_9HYPO|nr:hypothetical protein NM208_g1304 [Fusarium decemcellulare]